MIWEKLALETGGKFLRIETPGNWSWWKPGSYIDPRASEEKYKFSKCSIFLACTHQDSTELRARHLAKKNVQTLHGRPYKIHEVTERYRHWCKANFMFQKATQEQVERCPVWILRVTGSETSPPSHPSGNCLFKNVVTSLWIWGGARPR